MEFTLSRWIFLLIIVTNIIGFVLEVVTIHPGSFNNYLILSLFTLVQSFINVLLAGILIITRYIVKTKEKKDNVSIIINGFWVSAGLSLILAIGYCFIGVPMSRGKAPSNITSPATPADTGTGLGY